MEACARTVYAVCVQTNARSISGMCLPLRQKCAMARAHAGVGQAGTTGVGHARRAVGRPPQAAIRPFTLSIISIHCVVCTHNMRVEVLEYCVCNTICASVCACSLNVSGVMVCRCVHVHTPVPRDETTIRNPLTSDPALLVARCESQG